MISKKGGKVNVCNYPLARLELLGETYTNKQGGKSHKAEITSWADIETNLEWYKKKYRRIDKIPCGQCMECRLNKARTWANRLVLEKADYPEEECWFVTLTYNDDNIIKNITQVIQEDTGEIINGISLKKDDLSRFIKSLRKQYERKNITGIRFFACGEYGSAENTHRPHYHIIFFGLPLDQSKLKFYKHNEMGQTIWTHKELEDLWGKGFVTIGRVTWESCCYVARYVTKKQTGKNAEWYYKAQGGIEPEYVNMSRMPGIGAKYFDKNKDKIYETDSIPIANKKTAELMIPPKYFDMQMEKINPQFMEELKKERKRRAELQEINKNKRLQVTPTEYRMQNEERIKQRTKSLIREI